METLTQKFSVTILSMLDRESVIFKCSLTFFILISSQDITDLLYPAKCAWKSIWLWRGYLKYEKLNVPLQSFFKPTKLSGWEVFAGE